MIHNTAVTVRFFPTAKAIDAIAALSTPTTSGLLLRLILRQLRLFFVLASLISRTRKGEPAALHDDTGNNKPTESDTFGRPLATEGGCWTEHKTTPEVKKKKKGAT